MTMIFGKAEKHLVSMAEILGDFSNFFRNL